MNNSNVQVRFRFLNLDKMQAYTLKKEINGASFYADDERQTFVGWVPLEEHYFDVLNDYFIRQQIQYHECDILVTAIPSKEASTLTVPRVVNKMLKYIDCKLTYGIRYE